MAIIATVRCRRIAVSLALLRGERLLVTLALARLSRLTALAGLITLLINVDQFVSARGMDVDCPWRDAAIGHSDLIAFRADLKRAVARRDAAAVLKLTDANIRTSFGPDDGLPFFKQALSDKNSDTWKELQRVLGAGGFFEAPGVFVAPFWIGCGEPYEDVVVVGTGVRVRSGPRVDAPVMTTVSYAILQGSHGLNGWAEVSLKDGRRGFVASRFVGSPIGYRAYIEKTGGAWRLISFIGGD